MSSTIEIVCPMLENKDEERFKLLVKSLDRFVKDKNYKIHLINQTGKAPVKSKRIISYKESDIDSLFNESNNLYYSWWKQQLLKLMSHRICSSECVLFVDCDCFLTKSLESKNLYKNRKIKIRFWPDGSFKNWYNGSKNILHIPQYKTPENKIGVMPIALSRTILSSLEKYLRFLYGDNFGKYLLLNTNRDTLTKCSLFDKNDYSSTWTETSLYHIYAGYTGMISDYHTIDHSYELYGNCFWDEKEAESWEPELSFKRGHKFYFSVGQSSAKKTSHWIKEKIETFLV